MANLNETARGRLEAMTDVLTQNGRISPVEVGVNETLFAMNQHQVVRRLHGEARDRLVGVLEAMEVDDPSRVAVEIVDQLVGAFSGEVVAPASVAA